MYILILFSSFERFILGLNKVIIRGFGHVVSDGKDNAVRGLKTSEMAIVVSFIYSVNDTDIMTITMKELTSLKLHIIYVIEQMAWENELERYDELIILKKFMWDMVGWDNVDIEISDRIELYDFLSSIDAYVSMF